ncbi:MAG: DUF2207 domain-containing protein [Terriglobales bacterium]
MRAAIRVFAVAVLLCAAARADERILFYRSDITVQPDSTLRVTETIRVTAEHSQITHGIYRDFPTDYKDRWGNRYSVHFEVLGAERDGLTELWHTERLSNGVRVYLGDKNTTVTIGTHTYALTYSVTREIGFFSDHDELFWNVTGNGWGFPIDEAAAWVHLPAAIPRTAVKLDGYTGFQNSREKAFRTSIAKGDPFFTATRRLTPHEGLSIVVTFPKGLITEPTQHDLILYWIQDNAPAFVGAIGLVLTFLYFVVVWVMVGRDPRAGTIMPIYDLPPEFSPAAVRYLKNMGYDDKVFAAAVIDLAVKKKITIRQDSDKTYTILPVNGADDSLLTKEEAVLRSSFSGETELKSANWQTVSAAVKAVKHELKASLEKIYFFSHGGYMIPGVALSALTAVVMIGLAAPTGDNTAMGLCLWLSIWTFGVAMLVRNAIRSFSQGFAAGITASLFTLIFLAAEVFVIGLLSRYVSIAGVLILIAMAPLNLVFHHLLKAPTLAGRRLLDKIDGFRVFLSATEEDVLNRMNPPERTPALFEKYLPFAVALDCEKAWGAQFARVLAAAGTGGAQYSPSWYSGSNFSPSNFGGFASSFSSGLSSAISSSSSAPGSSSGASGGSGG